MIEDNADEECRSCTHLRRDLATLSHGTLWYDQYCAASPKSDEEKAEEDRMHDEHFVEWSKSTNNGALCQVPFAPGSGSYSERKELEVKFHKCRDTRENEVNCDFYEMDDSIKGKFSRKLYSIGLFFRSK